MNKASLEDAVRDEVFEVIVKALSEHFDTDVLFVSKSAIMMPCVDPERNERFAKITVTIPRGTRNGEGGYTPYNGYDEAKAYQFNVELKAEEKRIKAENRAKEQERKDRKREAKKLEKELNEKGLKKVIEEAD